MRRCVALRVADGSPRKRECGRRVWGWKGLGAGGGRVTSSPDVLPNLPPPPLHLPQRLLHGVWKAL